MRPTTHGVPLTWTMLARNHREERIFETMYIHIAGTSQSHAVVLLGEGGGGGIDLVRTRQS